MNLKRATELQEQLTREAVSLIVLVGTAADTAPWLNAISLVGKAWEIPQETTQTSLNVVEEEWRNAASGNGQHVYPESELPMNATGTQTLNNVWDLFESAVQLSDYSERVALLNIAHELADCQILLDWIEQTPEEKIELRGSLDNAE